MKIQRMLVVIGTLLLLQSLGASARDIYRLTWRGTCFTTSPTGQVLAVPYSGADIIRKCAQDNGISDVRSLALVYVANEEDIEVVFAATGEVVCEIFQLEYRRVAVANNANTVVRRQAFIFNEAHSDAIGSVFGSENSTRDTQGNLIRFSYRGNFEFGIQEENKVCHGTFATGARLRSQ